MVMIPQYGESHSLEHNTISTNQNELYTFREVQLLENRNYEHCQQTTQVLFNEFQEILETFLAEQHLSIFCSKCSYLLRGQYNDQ